MVIGDSGGGNSCDGAYRNSCTGSWSHCEVIVMEIVNIFSLQNISAGENIAGSNN